MHISTGARKQLTNPTPAGSPPRLAPWRPWFTTPKTTRRRDGTRGLGSPAEGGGDGEGKGFVYMVFKTGWWFGTCFICPNSGDDDPI